MSVRSAVRVQKAETRGRCPFARKLSGVTCTVVRTAQRDEILDCVRAAFGARPEMVHVHESRVPAAGHPATPAVAAQHLAPERRRDGLRRARGFLRCAHVGSHVGARLDAGFEMPDVLPIALGHFDYCLRHLDELTAAVLLAVPAALAYGERHLITRAGFVPRAFEDAATEEQDGRVVIECFARFAPNLRHGFAKAREHFARDLEAEHVTPGVRVRDIARATSGTMARYELFHLAHRAAPRCSEPLPLGLWDRHTRELPHRREAEGP